MLDALKALFFGERFVPADAVPRSLLESIAQIPRLTGLLPYLGWLPEEKLFVLDNGAFGQPGEHSLGFCIEIVPQTGANEEMERVLASLFMSCPPGTGIQVTLYATPHILPVLRQQANMLPVDPDKAGEGVMDRRNRNIFRTLARRRIDHYLKGKGESLFKHHVFLLRDYRCVISITMPLQPDKPADVEEAMRIRESVHATLRSAHLPGADWGPRGCPVFCVWGGF